MPKGRVLVITYTGREIMARVCDKCNGTGKYGPFKCIKCNGSGTLKALRSAVKKRGLDVALLKVAAAKLLFTVVP